MIRRLLIRPGAIGDFIVSLPALTALKADYTEVWCRRETTDLARFADRAVALPDTGIDRLGLLNDEDVVERLRSFDSIISWYGAGNADFRRTVDNLNLPLNFLSALPGEGRHAVDYYNDQTRGLLDAERGGKTATRYPLIDCPPRPREFAVIHPFASGPAKRAPLAVFEGIADRLRGSMPVEWVRGPQDVMPGARCFENLYNLACWLRGARVFVGNDSGISHLAAATGTPAIVIFGSADGRVWSPRGPAVETITQLTATRPQKSRCIE